MAVSLPAKFDLKLQSWDMAFKGTQKADYVVGEVQGALGADRYLLHQVRARMDMPETLLAVRRLSAGWPEVSLKLVEDKANGPAVIQSLRHEISGFVEVNPEGGKVSRAAAASPQLESGNWYLPHAKLIREISRLVRRAKIGLRSVPPLLFPGSQGSRYATSAPAPQIAPYSLSRSPPSSALKWGHRQGLFRPFQKFAAVK